MKTILRTSCTFFAATLLIACQGPSRPRVIRLALNATTTAWHLTINGHDIGDALSEPSLTNRLGNLHLHEGDCLLFDAPPQLESPAAKLTAAWVSHSCQSRRVAVYLTHQFAGIDIFSVPAYHWTAPYGNPFDLPNASFFREGAFLGNSTNGFEKMLSQIAQARPEHVFILGGLYDFDKTWPPEPAPYATLRARLDDTLRASRTDLIRIEPLPGF